MSFNTQYNTTITISSFISFILIFFSISVYKLFTLEKYKKNRIQEKVEEEEEEEEEKIKS